MKTVFGFLLIILIWISILFMCSIPLSFILSMAIDVSILEAFYFLLVIFIIKIALNPISIITHLSPNDINNYADSFKKSKTK